MVPCFEANRSTTPKEQGWPLQQSSIVAPLKHPKSVPSWMCAKFGIPFTQQLAFVPLLREVSTNKSSMAHVLRSSSPCPASRRLGEPASRMLGDPSCQLRSANQLGQNRKRGYHVSWANGISWKDPPQPIGRNSRVPSFYIQQLTPGSAK